MREKNRVLYLVNEMLQDISSFIPLDSKVVIIYNNKKEIEDYDYPEFDGKDIDGECHIPYILNEYEEGEETTLKKACLIKNNLLDNLNFELSDFGI